MGTLADNRMIVRDKNKGAGAAPYNVVTNMVPSGLQAAVTATSISAGNTGTNWAISSNVVSPAGSSVAAGTYTLTITFTFSYASPYNTDTATLTIIVPTDTYYVDPATGNDASAGTATGTAWAHAPGDPNATGVAAGLADPSHLVLIAIKGGSTVRSYLAPTFSNLFYAGGEHVGYGSGETLYTGGIPLGASTTPSSPEVFANPLFSTMKKWTASYAWSQYMLDRDNGAVIQVAQWPEAGPDPWLDDADPGRSLTSPYSGGMYRIPAADLVVPSSPPGVSVTATVRWPAALVTKMAGNSLVGYYLPYWDENNTLSYRRIDGDDGTFGTFTTNGNGPNNQGYQVVQVIGHPLFITGNNQWAWDATNTHRYVIATGTNIEVMGAGNGLSGGPRATLRAAGLTFDGWGSDINGVGGSAIVSDASASNFTCYLLSCTARWCSTGNSRAAGVLFTNLNVTPWVYGCTFKEMVRGGGVGFRNTVGNTIGGEIIGNTAEHVQGTAYYIYGVQSTVFRANYWRNVGSIHGNGATFYNNADSGPLLGHDFTISYNVAENVVRPVTLNKSPAGVMAGNLLECDNRTSDSARVYTSAADQTYSRNAFMRPRNTAGSGNGAVTMPNPVANDGGTFDHCVADGVTPASYYVGGTPTFPVSAGLTVIINATTVTVAGGGWANLAAAISAIKAASITGIDATSSGSSLRINSASGVVTIGAGTANTALALTAGTYGPTWTNTLVTQVCNNRYSIENNASPNSGNLRATDLTVWNGTFTGQMRQFLGKGRVGDQMITGWTVIGSIATPIADKVNQAVSTAVTTGTTWLAVATDGADPKTITASAGFLVARATSSGGAGATAAASSVTVSNGQFLQFSTTTSASYQTTTTGTFDCGEGCTYTWNVTTARPTPWPLINLDGSDLWQVNGTSTPLTSHAASTGMTAFFAVGDTSSPPSSTKIFFGQQLGTVYYQFSMIGPTGKLRFILKNGSSNFIAQFDTTNTVSSANPKDYLLVVDTTQAVFANGAKLWQYDRGADTWTALGLTGSGSGWAVSTVVGGAAIAFDRPATTTGGLRLFGSSALDSAAGFFLWDAAADFSADSSNALKNQFEPLQIGYGQFQNPAVMGGLQPIAAFVGDVTWWTDSTAVNTGINRGTGAKFKVQATTSITPSTGASTVWPSYTYADSVVIDGPDTLQAGVASTFTVNVNGSVGVNAGYTVSLSDGGAGGSFTAISTFAPIETPVAQTFTYTPLAAGPVTLTASASGLISDTMPVTVLPANATAYTISNPGSGLVGAPIAITVNLNGLNPSGVNITFAPAGTTATFDTNPLQIAAGATSGTVNVTPTSAGTLSLSATNDIGLTNPSPVLIVITSAGGSASGVFNPVWNPRTGRRGQR
jgi:hypothetical protein